MDLTDDDSTQAVDAAPGADLENTDGTAPQQRLRRMAKQAEALEGAADTKLGELTKLVKKLLKDGYNPIVFCRFIPTAEYVAEHLGTRSAKDRGRLGHRHPVAEAAHRPHRTHDLRRARRRGHRRADPSRAARPRRHRLPSEGVNLQEGFDAVIHYDLAWNPTRHEQREGRVDRYGQRRDVVRTVTLYGSDNQIDGIVLDILIRKHAEIRKATGVSVAVLDESDSVVNAVLEGLLLREEDAEQLSFDFGFTSKRDDLHADWVSAAERERASRARFAQHAIHADEVAREVTEIRAALGSGAEAAEFVRTAVVKLRGQISREAADGSFTADTGGLPSTLMSGLEAVLGPKKAREIAFHSLPRSSAARRRSSGPTRPSTPSPASSWTRRWTRSWTTGSAPAAAA